MQSIILFLRKMLDGLAYENALKECGREKAFILTGERISNLGPSYVLRAYRAWLTLKFAVGLYELDEENKRAR